MISVTSLLILFPFTDQTTTKKRPTVVVSSAFYNRNRPDLVLMAVTSQIRPSASFGEVTITHWDKAGLIKPSVIKPIFTTIEKTLVLRRLGRLEIEDRETLKKELQSILG
jgi:mRNA interferase MazF